MTIPVSRPTVSTIYAALQDSTVNVKSYLNNLNASIAAGSVSGSDVLASLAAASSLLEQAQSITTDAGLVALLVNYANAQVSGTTFNSTSLETSMTALAAVVSAIMSEYPKDASGYLTDRTFSSTGTVTWAAMTGSQFPQTGAAITAWLATLS